MANGKNMNLTASLRLNTKEFQKGVKNIQRSIKDLQKSFLGVTAALGAGLGFSRLLSSIKDTAVALNSAEVTLKNVSQTSAEFAENQEFLKKIAISYGQDVLTLTESFAKFRAAASQSNLTLEQQRDIFDSLTRAAGAYQLSSDQTKNAMMAVEQMLSKGKVTSEELRRQLGNTLPGAFTMMAKAAGMAGLTTNGTTAELEKLMKEGKLLAEDVLPHFAKVLQASTANANFDTLQGSINRLKTTWTEVVKSSQFGDFYKGMIDGLNKVLKFVGGNFKTILVGTLGGIFGGRFWNASLAKGSKYYDDLANKAKKLTSEANKYAKQLDKIEEKYKFQGKRRADSPQTELNAVEVKRNGAFVNKNYTGAIDEQDIKLLQKYNRSLYELQKTENELGYRTKRISSDALKSTEALTPAIQKTGAGIKTLEYNTTKLQKVGAGIKVWAKGVGSAISGMLQGLAAGAIIGGALAAITALIEHFRKLKKEAKEIEEIVPKMLSAVGEGEGRNPIEVPTEDIAKLERINKLLEEIDKNGTDAANRQKIIDNVNTALNRTGKELFTVGSDIKNEIIPAIDGYINKLKDAAKQQAILAQVNEKTAEIVRLQTKNMELQLDPNYKKEDIRTGGYGLGYTTWEENRGLTKAAKKLDKEIAANNKKIEQYQKGVDILLGLADKDTLAEYYKTKGPGTKDSGDTGGTKVLKGIEKVFEDWKEEREKLTNLLKQGAISEAEYNEELDKLISKTWKSAAETGKLDIGNILGKIQKGQALTKMEEWYYNLYESAKRVAGNILIKGVQDAIDKSIEEGIKEMEDALDKALEKDLEIAAKGDALKIKGIPTRGKRNSLFDYNKEQSDILEDEVQLSKDWADALKDVYEEYKDLRGQSAELDALLDSILSKLNKAKQEATDFENAMNVAKITEDIRDMQNQIRKGVYGGIKDLATTMDRMVKGVKSVQEAFEDTDTSGWEKFVAVFDLITNTIDGVVGIIETFNTVSQLTTKIDMAELSLIEAKNKLYREQLATILQITAAKKSSALATAQETAAEGASIAVSKASTAASSKEAVAGATASAAKLPFPWNLAAIALAVTTVLAALTSGTMKFAKGGLVGGSSFSGDNVLARVNSGEMILNKGQQATLFNAIKSGNLGGGGKVEFEIRGDKLKGVLQNYDRIRKG